MKIKKIAAVVIAAAVLVTTTSLTAVLPGMMNVVNAEEAITEGNYEYLVNEDGETVTITKYNGKDTAVDIPAVLGEKTVTEIGIRAFELCNSLRSITIPDSVTKICYRAFACCRSLTSVTLSNNMIEIGESAFYMCTSITSIVIPDCVVKLNGNIFEWCSSLEEVIVEENNENYASVDGVLFDNKKTELICYPAGKKDISYTIPDSVVTMERSAFYASALLEEISVGENNISYSSDNGVLFDKDKSTLIHYPSGKKDKSYTIPSGVIKIDRNAFYTVKSLESIIIPDGMPSIGNDAFYSYYGSLKSITIPISVTAIGSSAFMNCTSLETVYYGGSKADWRAIEISDYYNECLTKAQIICTDGVFDPNEPADEELDPGDSFVDGVLEYKVLEDGTLEVKVASNELKEVVEEVIIPEEIKGKKVTSIGNFAFYGCKALTSVVIPESVTSIGGWAFKLCSSLISITIPNGVTIVNGEVFCGCTSLISVLIPNSVTRISGDAFTGCTSLTSIMLPNSVTIIGGKAFYGCTSLTSITIPNSVTTMGEYVFFDCTGLTEINVNADNKNYCSVDGVLFNKDKTELIQYPLGKSAKGYTIPNGVTSVVGGAFSGCTSLTSVTIPNSVTNIGNGKFIPGGAFSGCTGLTSIEIPNSVTSIGDIAFYGCTGLASITISEGVTSIGSNVFSNCTGVTSIIIPKNVTTIGGYAFSNCTALREVTIPDSVTKIVFNAFDLCAFLETVYYSGTKADWEAIAIGEHNECLTNAQIICTDGIINEREPATDELKPGDTFVDGILEYKVLEDGTLEVKGFANQELKDTVEELIIPDEVKGKTVTNIGARAFFDCKFTSVAIPGSVTSIESYAFSGCKLASVAIPDGVTSIGNDAFWSCRSLESVMISNSVTDIDGNAFGACFSLKEICVDENNERFSSVDGVLFNKDQTKLICYPAGKDTSYDVPSGVIEIGNKAFDYCSSLTSVTIPDSVTSIRSAAFWGCASLESVTIPDGVTIINLYTFWGCSSLKSLTVPDSVTRVDPAFEHCNALTDVYFGGSKSQWEKIDIYDSVVNDPLINATIHFAKEDTEETKPEETQPEETKPEETQPEETKPDETQPEETKPDETQPEETKPDETQPEETKPDETQPEDTKPDETQPEETKPDETQPEDTKPDETQPEETKPDETQPEETKPDETQPEDTRPDETQTTETEPDSTDKKYEISTDVEIPPEAADISEDDTVKSITINVFNMKNKGEIDLSKVTIKAQEIYDEDGLKRAEEALGEVLNGNTHYNLLDLTLLYKGEDFSNGYEGLIQVKFKIPNGHKNKTFSCYRLTEVDGKMVKEVIPGTQTEDYYIIYLEHFSLYALVAVGDEVSTESEPTSVPGDDNSSQTANPNTGVTAVATACGIAAFSGAAVLIACKKRR